MSNQFNEFGDRIVAKSEPMTKPVILDDLKRTTERFLDLAEAAESPSDQEEPSSDSSLMKKARVKPVSESQSRPMNLALNSLFDPFDFDALFAAATPPLTSHAVRQADPQIRSQNYFQYPGNFSPRLDYGFFGTGNSFSRPNPTSETPWLTYVISDPSPLQCGSTSTLPSSSSTFFAGRSHSQASYRRSCASGLGMSVRRH